jgi:hypothetical protein
MPSEKSKTNATTAISHDGRPSGDGRQAGGMCRYAGAGHDARQSVSPERGVYCPGRPTAGCASRRRPPAIFIGPTSLLADSLPVPSVVVVEEARDPEARHQSRWDTTASAPAGPRGSGAGRRRLAAGVVAPAAASAAPARGKEVSRFVLIGAVTGEGLIILSITGLFVIVWAVAIYLFARDR